jgi:hypothetical protein
MSSVSRFRLTTIWACLLPTLLEGGDPGADALVDPADPLGYRELFRGLLEEPAEGSPIGVPWSDQVEGRFWREYATHERDAVPEQLSARDASRFVVPVHHPTGRGGLPDCPPWKLACHAFLYPFGPAVVLHAEHPHPDAVRRGGAVPALALEDLVEACYDLRVGGDADDPAFWDRFVHARVDAIAPRYGAQGGRARIGAPMTIATFVEADVHALRAGLRDRVLNALTVWPDRPVWRDARMTDRLEVALGPRHAAGGRLIHAARRGRAVWFPDGFARGGSLSEMHRRLTFVTMQTEMLVRFLTASAGRPPLSSLPPTWSDWAHVAARAIGPLYAGRLAAADSNSPALQVDSSGAKGSIDAVRRFFGLDAMH